jgi:hypothetical protein
MSLTKKPYSGTPGGRRSAPALAAVLGHLDQPVVGAGVEQALDDRRLGQRRDRVYWDMADRSQTASMLQTAPSSGSVEAVDVPRSGRR